MSNVDPKVIVALDFEKEAEAMNLVSGLAAGECRLKVGKDTFSPQPILDGFHSQCPAETASAKCPMSSRGRIQ